VNSICYSPDSKVIVFVGKGKNDQQYKIYTFNVKKELKAIEPDNATPLIPNIKYRISWGKGWYYPAPK